MNSASIRTTGTALALKGQHRGGSVPSDSFHLCEAALDFLRFPSETPLHSGHRIGSTGSRTGLPGLMIRLDSSRNAPEHVMCDIHESLAVTPAGMNPSRREDDPLSLSVTPSRGGARKPRRAALCITMLGCAALAAPTAQAQDTDGDGMPDEYERAHGCLNWQVRDGHLDPEAIVS